MNKRPFVFVPGIKGSRLIDAHGSLRWLGLKQVLGLDNRTLDLPLMTNHEEGFHPHLIPDGPIRRILWESVYDNFLDMMDKHQLDLAVFSYDWRLDCFKLAENLKRFIESIVETKGPVTVIAHSLGGLLTFHVANSTPELFHSILFAGVPFGPGIDFARDMHLGSKIGLNHNIINAKTHFSWQSPYVFFPIGPNNKVITPAGKAVPHDWHSESSWEKLKLSVFKNHNQDPTPLRNHLKATLKRAYEFRSSLTPSADLLSMKIPTAVLASQAHPTLSELIYDENKTQDHWDFDNGRQVPGDGRVEIECSLPPKPLDYQLFLTKNSHAKLLDDREVMQQVLRLFESESQHN